MGVLPQELARLAVYPAAKEWWESHRPVGWTVDQHLEHPAVNTSTEAAGDLARAVAKAVKEANPGPAYLLRSLKHERGEFVCWWGSDSKGYTEEVSMAGRYTREDAELLVESKKTVTIPESEVLEVLKHSLSSMGKVRREDVLGDAWQKNAWERS